MKKSEEKFSLFTFKCYHTDSTNAFKKFCEASDNKSVVSLSLALVDTGYPVCKITPPAFYGRVEKVPEATIVP